MAGELKLYEAHVKMNSMEREEVDRLTEFLGSGSRSETFRSAVRLVLAEKDLSIPDETDTENGIVSMYANMMSKLRIEMLKLNTKLLGTRYGKNRLKVQKEIAIVKDMINCITTARKEEYVLRDIVEAVELKKLHQKDKDIELKKEGIKLSDEALQHRKAMDILDRS